MLSPLISLPTPIEIHELVIVHSREEAQLLETDGAARGETKLAWAIPSRDRGRRSQPHMKTMERSDREVRWGIKELI